MLLCFTLATEGDYSPMSSMLKSSFAVVACLMCALSSAAEYEVKDLGWGSLSGNSLSVPGAVTFDTDDDQELGSIAVQCTTPGVTRSVKGTWSVEVEWKPTVVGEAVPTSIKVEFGRTTVLTADGNGSCTVTDATSVIIDRLNSSDYSLSGYFTQLDPVTLTSPLVLNSSGKYVATFAVTSDLLKAFYNSSSSVVSKAEEHFTVLEITSI